MIQLFANTFTISTLEGDNMSLVCSQCSEVAKKHVVSYFS